MQILMPPNMAKAHDFNTAFAYRVNALSIIRTSCKNTGSVTYVFTIKEWLTCHWHRSGKDAGIWLLLQKTPAHKHFIAYAKMLQWKMEFG